MAPGTAFYSGAFSPAKRTSPIDNTDYDLNDAYKPTGSTTQPERSLTGGATAPNPGAGANPYAAPGVSAGTPGSGSSQPSVVNDPYAPMLKHLSDASQNLESAYSAPHSGTARQIFGALLGGPIGGLVSGETRRNRNIQQATEDYSIANNQVLAARAQQNQQVENKLKGAQADEATAKGSQAAAEAIAQPQKAALEAAQTEAANYKEDPNLGLIDLRTKKPLNDSALAPLNKDEAAVLGKNEGDRVPVKLKNTANEIANRGKTTINTEDGVFDYNRQTQQKTRLGNNPRAMFAPENRIIPGAFDPENPGVLTFGRAGDAVRQGAQAPGSVGTTVAKTTAKAAAPGGKIGDQITAFQTAQAHSDLLKQAITALHNGDEQTLNGMKNSLKNEFGVAGPVTAQAISDAYQREVTSMLSKGHITDNEIASVGKTLDTNRQSPAQMLAVIDAYKGLAGSKLKILQRNVEAGMHGKSGFDSDQAAPAAGAATHRFNPATGQIEAIQ